MERRNPQPGEIYRHFKNRLYQIVCIATYSEGNEKLVVYQALYGGFNTYARPLTMFMSEVDKVKYPDVKQKYRFEKIERMMEKEDSLVEEKSAVNVEEKVENKDAKDSYNECIETPDADLLAFLDAETFEEKRNILVSMRTRITDRLINDIAASMDITVDEGDLETRYRSLLYCVSKMDEYEVNRLR